MPQPSEFVALARISHESFVDRRRYEWKISFSLWAALGSAAYWASKEEIQVFDSGCEAAFFGVLLLFLYTVSVLMISYSHHQDKNWKHYYMARAAGEIEAKKPSPAAIPKQATQIIWCVTHMGFTLAIVFLAIQIIQGTPA